MKYIRNVRKKDLDQVRQPARRQFRLAHSEVLELGILAKVKVYSIASILGLGDWAWPLE